MASPYLQRKPRTLDQAQGDLERRRSAYGMDGGSDHGGGFGAAGSSDQDDRGSSSHHGFGELSGH
ncbi:MULTISPECIES: hypothetical protein [Iodidimonas]|uniref:Uncharacterized protein n=1 Tax=Iodidimonas nitroreducens TaxID=1236968 RepID=A0A5A7ND71_9PROT|nr:MULTISPECIES: hypothetical protein [Iodidimonas]GAK34511.1 hypothetical protein AQ1_02410 [alpha proteobacterium Q-1]GER05450.1 hypothetical protein JCM17846_31320 [Iodidimonas nitroreducens]